MNQPKYTFAGQLAVGKTGEELVLSLVDHHFVVDVRNDSFFQRHDIDFTIDGESYEIKTDTKQTGNIFLELEAYGKPGAVFASRAQWWVYVRQPYGVALFIRLPELQAWLYHHAGLFPERTVAGGKARGVIIPAKVLARQEFVSEVWYGK